MRECHCSVLVHERRRRGPRMPLRVHHPQVPQLFQNGFVLHLFGDRDDTHYSTDLVYGPHERAVHGIVDDAPDVVPADLYIVDRQRLEVGERCKAVAEVVQPDSTPRRPDFGNEAHQLREVPERGGFGDLEAQRLRRKPVLRQVLSHGGDQIRIVQRGNAEVDRAEGQLERRVVAMPLTEDGDRLAHDPSVDGRHEPMALRLREERVGAFHTPTLVGETQENLAPRTCRKLRCQGYDRLSVQLKLALVYGSGEAHDPSGLDLLVDPGGRLRLRDMDAVASRVLGGIACLVGGAQHVNRASTRSGDRDDADANAQREAPLPPYVAELFDRPLQLPGDLFRLSQGTVFQ